MLPCFGGVIIVIVSRFWFISSVILALNESFLKRTEIGLLENL